MHASSQFTYKLPIIIVRSYLLVSLAAFFVIERKQYDVKKLYCQYCYCIPFCCILVNANVSRTNVTISGLSSGASMANQLHIAFSKEISGVGVLAGPPYYCAGSLLSAAACMSGPITSISVLGIDKKIKSFESAGTVDSTSNMVGDPVYIFSGKYELLYL